MSQNSKSILVTGAAGYIGRVFLQTLVESGWAGSITGLDKVAPKSPIRGVKYLQADMLEPKWGALIEELRPDALVHLAFVVDPMRDEELMRRINVEGTKKTLTAAKAAGVKHVIVASSATAYGAFADNPLPLRESDPLRAHELGFEYARDKAVLEEYYEEFRRENPSCALAIARPVIVLGPSVNNYISRFIYAFPVVLLPDGGSTPMQFVHEDDVAGLLMRIAETGKAGAFNLAGEGWLTLAEVCQMAKLPSLGVPAKWLRMALKVLWRSGWRRVEVPETLIDYLAHPWVVSTDRVTQELGYQMRFSSRDAVRDMLKRNLA